MAVLAHQEQDSTHISGAVFTAGITHRWITLEASGFHGQEPDEKRWGIEAAGTRPLGQLGNLGSEQ